MFIALISQFLSKKRLCLTVILTTIFIDYLSPGLVIPLLPLYAKKYGASAVTVGFLFAVFPLISSIVTPVCAAVSDYIGRKPILALSMFGSALSLFLYGISNSLIMLFIARACTGITGASIATATAYVADLTNEKERAQAMGRVEAVASAAGIIAPALGGFLGTCDIGTPFLVAAVLAFLNFCSVIFILPESLAKKKNELSFSPISYVSSAFKLLRHPLLRTLFLITFLYTVNLSIGSSTFSLFLDVKYSLSLQEISMVFLGMALISTISQYFLVDLFAKFFGEHFLLIILPVYFACTYIAITLSPNILYFFIILTLNIPFRSLFSPILNSLTSKQGREREYGQVFGLAISTGLFARIIGPPLGGFAFHQWGATTPWFLMAVLMVAIFLIAYRHSKINV